MYTDGAGRGKREAVLLKKNDFVQVRLLHISEQQTTDKQTDGWVGSTEGKGKVHVYTLECAVDDYNRKIAVRVSVRVRVRVRDAYGTERPCIPGGTSLLLTTNTAPKRSVKPGAAETICARLRGVTLAPPSCSRQSSEQIVIKRLVHAYIGITRAFNSTQPLGTEKKRRWEGGRLAEGGAWPILAHQTR